MPKKSKARTRVVRPRAPSVPAPAPARQHPAARWRLKMVLGGAILAAVLGVGISMRYNQPTTLAPQAPGTVDKHYMRGTAGAPVVIKEFSDYT